MNAALAAAKTLSGDGALFLPTCVTAHPGVTEGLSSATSAAAGAGDSYQLLSLVKQSHKH